METRIEKTTKRRREFRKQIWGIPKMLFILLLSLLFYLFTLILWGKNLNGSVFSDLIETIFVINISAVGLFMAVGYFNLKFLVTIIKSLLKIMFTVWVVMIVQLSSLEQTEQNVWIVLSAFFFVYFEVLVDINDCLFQIKDGFKLPKASFINSEFIKENSIAISIMCLSIINIILSHYIVDLLHTLKLG
ncbi:hypothetical protein ACFFK0_29935 [Paenibacillus chartarius]|uniref:Uncharacterized protein n=1 Tax=Paenibacillus chartarius TaxID=747481 RepID=A0ABV6DVE8_9BACL